MINNSGTKLIVYAAAASDSNQRVNNIKSLVFAGLVCEINGLKPKDKPKEIVFSYTQNEPILA